MENLLRRINFLDVPVDSVDLESALKTIEAFLLDTHGHQIVFLTINKILKARRDLDLMRCIRQSDLVLPVSKGIIGGARFQKGASLDRYNLFAFTIRLLALAERLDQSVYLLGARKEDLESAEKNLRISFPELKVVGRYAGYFDKSMEKNIILAIRKASPGFLLVGRGVPDQDKWIARNRKNLNPGVYLWMDNCFEIFSGREKSIPKNLYKLGLESLQGILKKPWRILGIFPYFYFKLLLLFYRIRGL